MTTEFSPQIAPIAFLTDPTEIVLNRAMGSAVLLHVEEWRRVCSFSVPLNPILDEATLMKALSGSCLGACQKVFDFIRNKNLKDVGKFTHGFIMRSFKSTEFPFHNPRFASHAIAVCGVENGTWYALSPANFEDYEPQPSEQDPILLSPDSFDNLIEKITKKWGGRWLTSLEYEASNSPKSFPYIKGDYFAYHHFRVGGEITDCESLQYSRFKLYYMDWLNCEDMEDIIPHDWCKPSD